MLLRRYISFLKKKIDFVGDETVDRITPLHGSILIWELLKFYEEYEPVQEYLEELKSLSVLTKEYVYKGVTLRNGMYTRGFFDAILNTEEIYAQDLHKLENSLLFNKGIPEFTLSDSSVQYGSSVFVVKKMRDTYFFLNYIISLLLEKNLHGCQILDLCLKLKYKLPENIFCILIKQLNKRLIKQISCWLIFGKLTDPNDEFFIKHVDSVRPGIADTFDSSVQSTSTSELIEEIYEIESSYLPCHVPYSLACKILNVGKLVSLLRHAPSYTKDDNFGIDECEIIKRTKELEDESNYHLTKLEEVVNFVWFSVNKQLKKLAEDVGCFFVHHRMLMDVYLMQRGDLMSDFVKRTSHIFQSVSKKTSIYSFNTAFRRAVNDSSSNLQNYSDLLTFILPERNIMPDSSASISNLEVQFKTPWPLHFIFSTDVMEQYNIIFRFLFELKYVHLNLLNSWKDVPQSKLSTELLYMKYKLDLILTNLESYVFVDVIQSENEVWETGVKKAESFNDIKLLLINFLSNVLLNLFLLPSNEITVGSKRNSLHEGEIGRMIVQKKISEIFVACNQFSSLVSNLQAHPQTKQLLKKINKTFKDSVKSIIKIIHESYKENDLPKCLLMRINYNNFYSPL